MSELRKASKDVAIYTTVNLIPIMLGFISIPIYTRIFDPAEYGQLSIVQMTANYTVIFMLTWISSSFLRFYEAYKKRDKEKEFVNTYLILLLIIVPASVVLYGIFLSFAGYFNWFDESLMRLFQIGIFLLFFNGFINFMQTYYRTKRKSTNFAFLAVSNSVFTLIAGLVMVLALNYRVDGILMGSAFISAIIAIVAVISVVREYGLSIKLYDKRIVHEAFIYGVPVIFSGFANWILRFSDRYVIEFSRGSYEVGLYSVAYNISEKSITLVITAISLAVTPILISTWERKGREETEKVLSYFSRYQYMLLLPATVGLILLAPVFMRVFVGLDFQNGVRASQIVAIGIFFLGLYNLTYTGLYIAKKTRTIARNVLLIGLMNVALNLLLVPVYGYIVASTTTALSYFLLWVISYLQTRNIVRWRIDKKSFYKISLATLVMGIFLYTWSKIFTENVFMNMASLFIGIMIYFMALFLMGEIKREVAFGRNYLIKKIGG